MVINKIKQVIGKSKVIESIAVRRLPVVALIGDEYLEALLCQSFPVSNPVVGYAENSVKNNNGLITFFAEMTVEQLHKTNVENCSDLTEVSKNVLHAVQWKNLNFTGILQKDKANFG